MSKGSKDFGDPPIRFLSYRVSVVIVCSETYSGSSLYFPCLLCHLALDGHIVVVLVSCPPLEGRVGSVEGTFGRDVGVLSLKSPGVRCIQRVSGQVLLRSGQGVLGHVLLQNGIGVFLSHVLLQTGLGVFPIMYSEIRSLFASVISFCRQAWVSHVHSSLHGVMLQALLGELKNKYIISWHGRVLQALFF